MKPIDQVVQDARTDFSKLFSYGPYFFLNFLLWNGIANFADLLFDLGLWGVAVACIGIASTTLFSVRADEEWYIERALKKAGYEFDTLTVKDVNN